MKGGRGGVVKRQKPNRRKTRSGQGVKGDWSPFRIAKLRYIGAILAEHSPTAARKLRRLADYQEWRRWRQCKPGTRCGYTWCGQCHDYTETWVSY